jgi:hypothetical protein
MSTHTALAAEAQLRAMREWGRVPSGNRYATLETIKQPTLIVHGNKDRWSCLSLNPYDRATFYTGGARGYTDYSFSTLPTGENP